MILSIQISRLQLSEAISVLVGRNTSAPSEDEVHARTNRRRFLQVDFWRILVAILLPPLGVFLQVGLGKHFWINVLLTILGYIPGIVHAVWVIAKY
jgi:uncharacterized membrane protein YqaE (UPF0057 family)